MLPDIIVSVTNVVSSSDRIAVNTVKPIPKSSEIVAEYGVPRNEGGLSLRSMNGIDTTTSVARFTKPPSIASTVSVTDEAVSKSIELPVVEITPSREQ